MADSNNAWQQRGRARGRTQPTTVQPGQAQGAGRGAGPRPGGDAPQRAPPAPQGGNGNGSRPREGGNGGNGGGGEGPSGGHGETTGPLVGRGAMRGRRPLPVDVVHTRPENIISKKGTSGDKINITCNYFKLCSVTSWIVNQYRVDFSPDIDHAGVRKALLRIHKEQLGGYAFDGTVLFCMHRFPKDPLELFSQRTGSEETTRITVRFVKQLLHGDFQFLQLFGIIMRKCFGALELQQVGRNFFDAKAKVRIDQFQLELWPGYMTSIHQYECDIMMCSEITHKVMRLDTAYKIYTDVRGRCRDPREAENAFKNAILGAVVLTDYNNRTYRVDDVDFRVSPSSTFPRKEGEISYIDYYGQKYGIRNLRPDQPMLVSRSKAREVRSGMPETVYLVPELCRLTGLTDEMRGNFHLMRAIAEFTRVGPDVRVQKLLQFARRLMGVPSIMQEFKDWNMELAPHLVTVEGRVLPQEKIVQGAPGHEIKYPAGQFVDWTKNLRANPMLAIGKVDPWAVVVPHNFARDSRNFIGMVIKAAEGMGLRMSQPYVHEIRDDRQGTYVNELEELLSHMNPQMVVCIVSNKRTDRYGAIKKKLCVDRPVPSQVITTTAMGSRGAMSVATKVAIQINCKVGGVPWTVENPLKGTMVVGFDVSHDTMNKSYSYGAMVASLNNNFSRFYSAVSAHSTGEELSNHLSINIVKALNEFRKHNNKCLPSRIIIYRDGVGDGQIPYVYNHEVATIKEQVNRMYSGISEKYRMAFIIVSKRINTRLFHSSRGVDSNPPPGTVVDDKITLPERYDFFIVSQSVRQGSVSPTSYNVIDDNTGLDPDKMQRFTYKMTHLYYNWSGTVKVPAPVQYAHKLAMLVGQSLHRVPGQGLEETLYYL